MDAYRLRYIASFVVSDRQIANIPPAVDGIHVEDVMICKAMP